MTLAWVELAVVLSVCPEKQLHALAGAQLLLLLCAGWLAAFRAAGVRVLGASP